MVHILLSIAKRKLDEKKVTGGGPLQQLSQAEGQLITVIEGTPVADGIVGGLETAGAFLQLDVVPVTGKNCFVHFSIKEHQTSTRQMYTVYCLIIDDV